MRWLGEASRLADRAAVAAEARWAVVAVFLGSVAVWWLQAFAMPLKGGRDFGTYLGGYVELFQSDPIDLGYVLGRTPIAPIVVGGLLDPLGGALAEPGVSVLYAMSITAWFLAARTFGGRAALVTTAFLVLYPGYGILFHEIASDSVFAVAFAGWALLAIRVLLAPRPAGFALVGGGIALLVLVRPGNQALLVLALLPLAIPLTWRVRLMSSAALVTAALAILGGWAVHNGLRFGDYTVARGGNSRLPFERVFLTERIVRPENGPASRQLADAVEQKLLLEEPYRSYGIGLEDFFSDPSPRMKDDLGVLANRLRGWDSDERLLRDAGVEAVRTHPAIYARGVATTVWDLLHLAVFRSLDEGDSETGNDGSGDPTVNEGVTSAVDGRALPRPTEGERIPAPHEGGPTTPDGSIYTVWTSPTENHLVFVRAGDEERYNALHRRIDELWSSLPDRQGSAYLALRFNQSSRWFPPPVLWLALGLVGLALRRPANALALATPAIAALVLIVVNALAIAAVPQYAVPAAPAFMLLAAGALVGARRETLDPSDG
ncbi:MAG: glycosyltransferase family 39 protein [Thermoleophilia bacterium]|nr:glycosyltransferase family 39 protein [Thermoleophilia bacterium]